MTGAKPIFEIQNLHASVDGKQVLKGVELAVRPGEVHAIMGRNGSGKTTLAYTLMGHPKYTVTQGRVLLNGEDLSGLTPDERARKRLFLAFQHPVAIPGVTVANFLRSSIRAVRGDEVPPRDVRKLIKEEAAALGIPDSFMGRSLNDGFSGGERKRLETLQMRLLQPRMAVLDETDSGLDIDALRVVSERIETLRSPERGVLLITHYQRMLDYIKPDQVHVFLDGRIVKSGGPGLALELEKKGYDWLGEEGATA
ncbi:MAG TPA: Fe-S cluster assembly ATPase SufC [Bdellovibrionota bacterium]|jgi:Fe-S cluster assembly ATP-binding protein|nr:Fe-S cluster assembly ATPase SufC [Bdellovibrionota bacterium]